MLEKITHRSQGSEVAPPGSRLADDEELGTVGSNISITSEIVTSLPKTSPKL